MISAGTVCKRAACAAVLLLPVLVATTAGAAEDGQPRAAGEVRQWLERTLGGVERLNFEGTFVYVQGSHVESMRITHGRADTGEWQRLNSLSGPKRLVAWLAPMANATYSPGATPGASPRTSTSSDAGMK